MTDNTEKVDVDLASIYRDLADWTSQEEDTEISAILAKIKKAASKGRYQIKIDIDEDIHDWCAYSFLRSDKIKPDLISKLEEYGFKVGNAKYSIGFLR
jgi:hypothetical protein